MDTWFDWGRSWDGNVDFVRVTWKDGEIKSDTTLDTRQVVRHNTQQYSTIPFWPSFWGIAEAYNDMQSKTRGWWHTFLNNKHGNMSTVKCRSTASAQPLATLYPTLRDRLNSNSTTHVNKWHKWNTNSTKYTISSTRTPLLYSRAFLRLLA